MDTSFSVVVLGDHGMTDVGSHGGASQQETLVPVLFLTPRPSPKGKKLIFPLLTKFNFVSVSKEARQIQQVDLAPTLAWLLGLTIPVNNVGIFLSSIFDKHQPASEPFDGASKIDFLRQNAAQLLQLFKRNADAVRWPRGISFSCWTIS